MSSPRDLSLARRLRVLRPRALWRYLRDPAKPWGPKLAVAAAVAYFIFPLDLIPDVPLVGFLDDVGVLGAALAYLARQALAEVDAPSSESPSPADSSSSGT